MTWRDIRSAFNDVALACREDRPIEAVWEAFATVCRANEAAPPAHLMGVMPELLRLADLRGGRNKVAILDHGTGTAINILFLAALGFTDVRGANVVPKAQPQNRVFREIFGEPDIPGQERIFLYPGDILPLPDESMDLILSQQVLEHVPDAVLDTYYAEEGRILRPGGIAIHQVPHRWIPYEGHTRTWLLTYLPGRLGNAVWRRFANNPEQIGSYLFLRDRTDHLNRAERHIGSTRDDSLTRLTDPRYTRDYEGPRLIGFIRRTIGGSMRIPLFGTLLRAAIRPISMLETCSVKR